MPSSGRQALAAPNLATHPVDQRRERDGYNSTELLLDLFETWWFVFLATGQYMVSQLRERLSGVYVAPIADSCSHQPVAPSGVSFQGNYWHAFIHPT